MRITWGLCLLLISLMLVSGCIFHRQPKSPEPIKFHEVVPTPALTNSVDAASATNDSGWDVESNTPSVLNPVSPAPASAPTNGSNGKMIVTPSSITTATVTWVNPTAKFVVLTFPIGHLPAMDQSMTLYRRGSKVGEVKITGPQKDDNVVADVVDGDAQLGDEVR